MNQPTFPLDEKELRSRKFSATIGHPLTWIVPLAVFLVPLVLMRGHPIGLVSGLVAGTVALAGMLLYWRGRGAAVDQRVVRKLIDERHREQDRLLNESIASLRSAGHDNYASTLERFVAMKQTLTARLHADGELTAKKMELNNLVDTVCFQVRDQLDDVVKLEAPYSIRTGETVTDAAKEQMTAARRNILTQVVDAFETLEQTNENLDQILHPEILDPDQARRRADVLQSAIDSLQQESKVASTVKNILRETESEDLPLDLDFE